MTTQAIIILLYTLAHFSRLTHRTAVPLSGLQWRLKGLPFGLRHKIKVMSYFERLSSNRKFGVTIGPTITLTIPVFSHVYNLSIFNIFYDEFLLYLDYHKIHPILHSHQSFCRESKTLLIKSFFTTERALYISTNIIHFHVRGWYCALPCLTHECPLGLFRVRRPVCKRRRS